MEKKWILYDVGNSAFTLLIATIMPIYFNYLADQAGISEVNYLAYWGYATSAATIIVAVLGPVLGAASDTKGRRKKIFLVSLLIGALGCVFLGFTQSWIWFLLLFVIAKSAYSLSLVVYDSMLPDVTTDDRADQVSAQGYAWGYIGSCIPFILSLMLVLFYDKIGLTMKTAMGISFLLVAVWWIVMSLPLLKNYRQKHYQSVASGNNLAASFRRLKGVFSELKNNRKILFFLIAFFFYIDGVYTIIDMATAYGSALGLDSTGLLLALLVTQIVAFPFAILFGRLAQKYPVEKLITFCVTAYFGIAVFAMFLHSQWQFWVLAVLVGMFQGGVQALSRSYFTKIIPPEQSGEYFGILDICGKGASFVGTTIVSVVSQVTGNMNLGVGMIAILFVVGLFFFRKAATTNA